MANIIYKYYRINENFFDVIISNSFYFSSISQFNDPYDCHFHLSPDITIDEFKLHCKSLNLDESMYHQYVNDFNADPEQSIKPFRIFFTEWLSYLGICCFSKTKEDMLMWSHYSDSHRGVCLGFDYDELKKTFKQYDKVRYSKKPFSFDIINSSKSIASSVLTKFIDWKYEKEIRFITERSRFGYFPASALREVNFGAKISNKNKMNIINLITLFEYKKATFLQAHHDDQNYLVKFGLIDYEKLRNDVMKESESKPFSKSFSYK